jgi:hypothetical protein
MTDHQPLVVSIPESGWADDVSGALFAQWCLKLAEDDLGFSQWGGPDPSDGSFRFGDGAGDHFVVAPSGARSWTVRTRSGIDQVQLAGLVATAAQRAGANETGEDLVYQARLQSPAPLYGTRVFTLHMMRILGDKRYPAGARRLSDRVLLDFEWQQQSGPSLFGPDVSINVTVFVPGPAPGELAGKIASTMFETASAISAFALGRPVELPLFVNFPSMPDDAASARPRRYDLDILGLARDTVSLDIFGELPNLGGADAMVRARNALITLHEAQKQTNGDVAVMLYVSAIEALVSPAPEHEWYKDQVTARFIDAVLNLCPDAVDAVLNHANAEAALRLKKRGGVKRQRRELVDRIYELRSLPTHTGLSPAPNTGLVSIAGDQSMTVALLSDLSRAALLEYLQGPRCFITGQPGLREAKQALKQEPGSKD